MLQPLGAGVQHQGSVLGIRLEGLLAWVYFWGAVLCVVQVLGMALGRGLVWVQGHGTIAGPGVALHTAPRLGGVLS